MANLRDRAAAARVSIRTVNRVLKNDGYVHSKTRHAVEIAVKKLGYRPNLAARSLRTAKSHLIAVLTFTEDELRMAQVAALEQRLRATDYLVSMTFHFESRQKAKAAQIIEELISQNPAGIVLLGHDPFVARYILPALMPPIIRSGLPCVLIDPRGTRHDAVTIDRARGVYDAVHYLAGRGARRIAFLGTQEERSRLDGYEQALRELGRAPIYLDYPGTDIEALRRTGRRFAAQKARPDAVVAHSDYIALAFLAGLHDARVDVPGEVALIGFDDRAAARYAWPALTTIAQPSREIGIAGAEILLKKIAGENRPASGWSQTFPTRLIIRETA
jgi:LacI family repressor for deo operon, udp, cdd, tsx, nupC, and nupG